MIVFKIYLIINQSYWLKIEKRFKSYVLPLHGAFLSIIKYSGYKIGVQFNSTLLVVEQNDYATKNDFTVYDLGKCQKIPLNKLH